MIHMPRGMSMDTCVAAGPRCGRGAQQTTTLRDETALALVCGRSCPAVPVRLLGALTLLLHSCAAFLLRSPCERYA
jgi:hypothetical protein